VTWMLFLSRAQCQILRMNSHDDPVSMINHYLPFWGIRINASMPHLEIGGIRTACPFIHVR